MTGKHIALENDTTLDASGQNGGGTVKVGGDYLGIGDTPTAERVFVGSNASIDVSAKDQGDAGEAIVWSDYRTDFHGEIAARGGNIAGNGGFVETSGKEILSATGFVDAGATNGERGQWLLDPNNIRIEAAGGQNAAEAPAGTFSSTDDDAVILDTSLEFALLTTDVTVQTASLGANSEAGNIDVNAPISWASNQRLTLQADNNINVNAAISAVGNGGLTLEAGGDGSGDININQPLNFVGGNSIFEANGGATTVSQTMTSIGGNLTFQNSNQVNIDATLNTTGGNILFNNNTGVDTDVALTTLGGDITFQNATTLEIGANLTTNGGDIDIANTVAGTTIPNANTILNANSGSLTIGTNGVATNNVSFFADTMTFNGPVTNNAGDSIVIGPGTAGATLGLGDLAAGTLQLSNASLANLADGDDSVFFVTQGATRGAGNAIDIHNLTTGRANVFVQAGTGMITVDGGGINTGTSNVQLEANNFDIAGNMTGTGAYEFSLHSAGNTMDIGGVGAEMFTDVELNNILDGKSSIIFQGQGNVNVNAYTWNDNVAIKSATGNVIINGVQNLGANNLYLGSSATASAENIDINAALNGTGTLRFTGGAETANTPIYLGDDAITAGGAGARIADASLGNISNNWTEIQFGGPEMALSGAVTGTTEVSTQRISNTDAGTNNITINTNGAWTIQDPIRFAGSGDITFQDEINALAASNASITISDDGPNDIIDGDNPNTVDIDGGQLNLSGATAGLGALIFENIDTLLRTGWDLTSAGGNITIANTVASTTLDANSAINAGTGTISVGSNGINAATHNLDIIADELILNGDLNGSGDLAIYPATAGATISLNDGNTTGLDFSAAELGRIGATTDFAAITVGGAAHTGTMNVGSWTPDSPLTLQAGSVNLDGNIDAGTNTLNVTANAGNIGYTSGTLTAHTLNLDATGTITADVNVSNALGIGNNSTATTLTGTFQGGATQTQANLITGGPGNDTNYTFAGLTIRDGSGGGGGGGGGSTTPTTPVEPEVEDDPETENENETDPVLPGDTDTGSISDPDDDSTSTSDPADETSSGEPETIAGVEVTELAESLEPVIDEVETLNNNLTARTEAEQVNTVNLQVETTTASEALAEGILTLPTTDANEALNALKQDEAVVFDGNSYNTVTSNYVPEVGDYIITGKNNGLEFLTDKGSAVRMSRDSEAVVRNLLFSDSQEDGNYIDVQKGAVGFYSDEETHKGEIKTILPDIAIKVIGTCYIVDFDKAKKKTDITLFGGGVELYIQGQLIRMKNPIEMISFSGKPSSNKSIEPVRLDMQDVRNRYQDRPEIIPSPEQLLKCGVTESNV